MRREAGRGGWGGRCYLAFGLQHLFFFSWVSLAKLSSQDKSFAEPCAGCFCSVFVLRLLVFTLARLACCVV